MTTQKVYSGICRGGPMDGKTHAEMNKRRMDISIQTANEPAEKGFYVRASAAGTRPAEWRWVKQKGN